MIAERGHEIASHGFSHTMVTSLTPHAFRDELHRTAALIEKQSGRRPYGYRAPQWSLSREKTPWAFEILAEEGYRYDSSCNPLRFVGDPESPRIPFAMNQSPGMLWEIPPLVTPSPIGNLPTGGGWGFRFFPFCLIEDSMDRLQKDGGLSVIYLHPRELDPNGPRLPLSAFRSFIAYGPRRDVTPRLVKLFEICRFRTLQQVVETWSTV
jgi:polysaccharide deacetylase family protein (PEP-CTERM system associated)